MIFRTNMSTFIDVRAGDSWLFDQTTETGADNVLYERQGNEISRQMDLNRTIPEITGECFYSTRPLFRNPRNVCDSIKNKPVL